MSQANNTPNQSTEKEAPNPIHITVPKKNQGIQYTRFTGTDNAVLTSGFSLDRVLLLLKSKQRADA